MAQSCFLCLQCRRPSFVNSDFDVDEQIVRCQHCGHLGNKRA